MYKVFTTCLVQNERPVNVGHSECDDDGGIWGQPGDRSN